MSSTWHKVEMLNKYLLKLVIYDYPESLRKKLHSLYFLKKAEMWMNDTFLKIIHWKKKKT